MIAWNPLASVHTVHRAEALLGAELNMSMTRSWTALTEVTTKSRAFQALSQLLLDLPHPSHASICLEGVVRTTRSHRCHRETLLSLVNFIGILFFEQSGQLCVVCMIKKAADGITK